MRFVYMGLDPITSLGDLPGLVPWDVPGVRVDRFYIGEEVVVAALLEAKLLPLPGIGFACILREALLLEALFKGRPFFGQFRSIFLCRLLSWALEWTTTAR